jgi:hypothetical protein
MAEQTKRTFTGLGEELANVMKKVMSNAGPQKFEVAGTVNHVVSGNVSCAPSAPAAAAPQPGVRQPAVVGEPEEVRSYWFISTVILGLVLIVVLAVLFIWRPPWFRNLLAWRPHFGTPAATQPAVTAAAVIAPTGSEKPADRRDKRHDSHRSPTTAALVPYFQEILDQNRALRKEAFQDRQFDGRFVAELDPNLERRHHVAVRRAYDGKWVEISLAECGEFWYVEKMVRRRLRLVKEADIVESTKSGQPKVKQISLYASSDDGVVYQTDNGKELIEMKPTEGESTVGVWKPYATLKGVTFYGNPEGAVEYDLWHEVPITTRGVQTGKLAAPFGNVLSVAVSALPLEEMKKIPEIEEFFRPKKFVVTK